MQHMMGLDSDMGAPDDQAYPRPYGDDSHGPSSGQRTIRLSQQDLIKKQKQYEHQQKMQEKMQ